MIYSVGKPVVSAIITTYSPAGGDPTVTEVKKGDTITDLTLNCGRPTDTVISEATVVGFIGSPAKALRGTMAVLDGVPTHNYDAEGDAHFGLIDERLAVEQIVVEIEDDAGGKIVKKVRVADIKSMGVTPLITDASDPTPTV